MSATLRLPRTADLSPDVFRLRQRVLSAVLAIQTVALLVILAVR
ncbi:hypothetical protein Q0Z83_012260 [Actinoplanes sichuanensis]|uniref:Sensor histidine kinase n=1 Tax=Actinoplanes sichuanensis TaxID=512349 RepID=A0ABW4A620_9ACTN|nr:hypothetical protein [Actinoplanes sichuanensis]BEL03035.1 hypothetical protein Q0Z83_012260 [Actinoplanes sichuanensis]